MTYCDNCGEPTGGEDAWWIPTLRIAVTSANEGESAVLCGACGQWYDEVLTPEPPPVLELREVDNE